MGGAYTGASLPGSANQYISPYNNSESMSNKSNNLGLRPRAEESFMGGADTGASLPGSANQYISPYNE